MWDVLRNDGRCRGQRSADDGRDGLDMMVMIGIGDVMSMAKTS